MMIGPSARRRSRPGAQRPVRSAPLPSGHRSEPSAGRSSSGLDRCRPPLTGRPSGLPSNAAPCPAAAVATPPPACKASLGNSFLAGSSPPVQGRRTCVGPCRWGPGRCWGVSKAQVKSRPETLWPVPIGPLLVHCTRASGEGKPDRWRVEHRPCRRRRRSRWGAQPPTAKRSQVVSHLHQHKDVAKPEPCHLGLGFCGDSVGTDVSARHGRSRAPRPSSSGIRAAAHRPAPAGRRWDSTPPSRRSALVRRPATGPDHLYLYKGAEWGPTVTVGMREKMGSSGGVRDSARARAHPPDRRIRSPTTTGKIERFHRTLRDELLSTRSHRPGWASRTRPRARGCPPRASLRPSPRCSRSRRQAAPRGAKRGLDGHVVVHRAGEAVDHVDDDGPDAAACHPVEHGLRHRSVNRRGRNLVVGRPLLPAAAEVVL